MSWPTDGKPRYVTAEIKGGDILRGQNTPEYYVYDRARCHRPVATLKFGVQRYDPLKGGNRLVSARVEVELICAELSAR